MSSEEKMDARPEIDEQTQAELTPRCRFGGKHEPQCSKAATWLLRRACACGEKRAMLCTEHMGVVVTLKAVCTACGDSRVYPLGEPERL